MKTVDVLIPTINRLPSLITTLTGVALQSLADLHVIVADQSDEPVGDKTEIVMLRRVIELRGGAVTWHNRPQINGIAEQRDFLLKQATADYILFLDDDVLMESWVVAKLLELLQEQGGAFIGAFPAGLSHLDDMRPEQQAVEFWDGPVQPEVINPNTPEWDRYALHMAANLIHTSQQLPPGEFRTYKIAWIASCILYERKKLVEVGGFSFWPHLPRYHSGEDVLVQNLLMRRWGGSAIMPSGTYYTQTPTTVLNEADTVDGHALELMPDLVARYAPETAVAHFSATEFYQDQG